MFGRARILLTMAACMLAMTPVAAQAPAPATTAFDGTYTGVSRTFEGAMGGGRTRGCQPSLERAPAPLTIVNGTARWGKSIADGSVSPQGVLVMHLRNGVRFDGQIDGRGTVTGRLSGNCSYQGGLAEEG
jgi:hypothetical protein